MARKDAVSQEIESKATRARRSLQTDQEPPLNMEVRAGAVS